jgi:hypothetical protein
MGVEQLWEGVGRDGRECVGERWPGVRNGLGKLGGCKVRGERGCQVRG